MTLPVVTLLLSISERRNVQTCSAHCRKTFRRHFSFQVIDHGMAHTDGVRYFFHKCVLHTQ
jgi:hypothetical protein